MQEHFDHYTVYFKGHVSQNDDNPAVKHTYMGFQLKLEEWRKKKKYYQFRSEKILSSYWPSCVTDFP